MKRSSCAADASRRKKSGQLQTLEPVIIVVLLAIIIGVVLLFLVRASDAQGTLASRAADEREAIALLRRITTLPELSCPLSETVETFCVDRAKAEAFAQMMNGSDARLAYFPAFGSTLIDLTWHDLSLNASRSIVIYDELGNASEVAQSATHFTVYDPVRDARMFATLTMTRRIS